MLGSVVIVVPLSLLDRFWEGRFLRMFKPRALGSQSNFV
jgi:hypothetical protein